MKHQQADYHPGIRIHAIKVGGCVAGAIFALGMMAIVLIGIPIAKWFFVAALVGGVAAYFVIHATDPAR
jgi:hypothetical protein